MIDRVGGTRSVPVDVRVIAANNADLVAAVSEGRFRSDLYYRLNVFPIALPPLRERREDVPLLAQHFLDAYRIKFKRPVLKLSDESMDRLVNYAWPGNVRELQNVLERAVILARSPIVVVEPQFLSTRTTSNAPSAALVDIERRHIVQILESAHWRIHGPRGAAARLSMNPSTWRSRMKKLGISRPANLPVA